MKNRRSIRIRMVVFSQRSRLVDSTFIMGDKICGRLVVVAGCRPRGVVGKLIRNKKADEVTALQKSLLVLLRVNFLTISFEKGKGCAGHARAAAALKQIAI